MNTILKTAGLAALALLAMPAAAHAGTCEDTFIKKGSIISGQHFFATISVADLPPDVAINQLKGIVSAKGYAIMAIEPAGGAMLIEQPMTGKVRAFPIEIKATSQAGIGTVQMEAKLRTGMNANADGAKAEMCGMLAQLKGGKAGKLAAASGSKAEAAQRPPLEMSALAFAHQIAKEAERNPGILDTRYAKQRFTINGQVDRITREGNAWSVWFKVPRPIDEPIHLPGAPSFNAGIVCEMAPGQSVFVAQLKPNKSVKLTGTWFSYADPGEFVMLKGCAPA